MTLKGLYNPKIPSPSWVWGYIFLDNFIQYVTRILIASISIKYSAPRKPYMGTSQCDLLNIQQ